jgi:hypothetical protein
LELGERRRQGSSPEKIAYLNYKLFNFLLFTKKKTWAAYATHMNMRNAYKMLFEKPKGKRLFARPGSNRKENIKYICEGANGI